MTKQKKTVRFPEFIVDPDFEKFLPPLSDEEETNLLESLRAEGCRDAIIVWKDTIIDGHNRYRLIKKVFDESAGTECINLKIEKRDFGSKEEALMWMTQNQLARRNWHTIDKYKAAIDVWPHVRKLVSEKKLEGKSREIVAKMFGIGDRYLSDLNKYKSFMTEEYIDKIRRKESSIHKMILKAKNTTVIDTWGDDVDKGLYSAKGKLTVDKPLLLKGDFTKQIDRITEQTVFVDAIITDPPYPGEFIKDGLYRKLAEFASVVLRPGGSLFAMIGQYHLPAIMEQMTVGDVEYGGKTHTGIKYQWILPYYMAGPNVGRLGIKKVDIFWKPILWYSKTKYIGDYVKDVIIESGTKEKDHGEWQQSLPGFLQLIETFTEPNHKVCDPMMGYGTTGVAAVRLGRRFVGVEMRDDRYRKSEIRIAEELKNRV